MYLFLWKYKITSLSKVHWVAKYFYLNCELKDLDINFVFCQSCCCHFGIAKQFWKGVCIHFFNVYYIYWSAHTRTLEEGGFKFKSFPRAHFLYLVLFNAYVNVHCLKFKKKSEDLFQIWLSTKNNTWSNNSNNVRVKIEPIFLYK